MEIIFAITQYQRIQCLFIEKNSEKIKIYFVFLKKIPLFIQ